MPDGRAHGYGKFKAANGNVYEGDWYQEQWGETGSRLFWRESVQEILRKDRAQGQGTYV